jgi:hypothetical protein
VIPAGWQVGVYGAGAICDYLASITYKGRKLATYYWLSASIGHTGHRESFDAMKWHLFQTWTDFSSPGYFGKSAGVEIDADVTNPSLPDFGHWVPESEERPPTVSKEEAERILAGHVFFVTYKNAWLKRNADGKLYKALKNKPQGSGHVCRIIECFPGTPAEPRETVAVNFDEGDSPHVYFYKDEIGFGLSKGNMPKHPR